jgi:hypothetical protein
MLVLFGSYFELATFYYKAGLILTAPDSQKYRPRVDSISCSSSAGIPQSSSAVTGATLEHHVSSKRKFKASLKAQQSVFKGDCRNQMG